MGFKCGIIGLPNVGKSTLFNALTESSKAEAANYPFATIEPNVGRVAVPDQRLEILGKIGKSEKIIPSYMDFVDIAGLVQGASKGEGLGNKFLGHIREVDAIAHVVRCFKDDNITHVSNNINPLSDIETINTELQLSDIETLEIKKNALEKKSKQGDKDIKNQISIIEKLLANISDLNFLQFLRSFFLHLKRALKYYLYKIIRYQFLHNLVTSFFLQIIQIYIFQHLILAFQILGFADLFLRLDLLHRLLQLHKQHQH